MIPEIQNKTIVILGAARSGLAVAKLLQKKGARIFVSDNAPADQKKNEIVILQQENITYEFGGHSDKIFQADFAVLSPGIPKEAKPVASMISRGIPVYSELEVAYWFCQSPIIAITGSNGKTTTTSLLGEIIQSELPDSIVAGNIGTALSDQVETSVNTDWAVVEVSSFQLETIDQFHPRIVMILNFAPNHLDWYKSYEDYVQAKLLILKNITSEDMLIYNLDDALLREKIKSCKAKKYTFSLTNSSADAFCTDNVIYIEKNKLIDCDEILLKGLHNYQNVMAAILAAKKAEISENAIIKVLKKFKGVEHRLEHVTAINGIHFINDSKATTIESLAVALGSFKTPIILIAGGKDKGGDYKKLNPLIAQNVRAAVLIGAAQEKMANTWRTLIPVYPVETLEDAVEKSYHLASDGENVLLSPACSSYDMFKDFEDRGTQFKNIVRKIKERKNGK
jgi:UDP-N-acetylmuramoylalanine--D-glutamate ligase